ncbi:sarcalumenin [Leptopilina boulardi]|uniref:sarcalumenin n=1 Tax=Leptopilina boulardi TaxID=63433 RepID=UPI0021F5F5A4|nr:sarcalumenin [Leptopilina boulardi]
MTGSRFRPAIFVGLFLGLLAISLQGVQGEEELEQVPSEDLCRPYIEKALKDLGTGSVEQTSAEVEAGDNQEEGIRNEELSVQGDEPGSNDGSQEADQDSGGGGETVEVASEEVLVEEVERNESTEKVDSSNETVEQKDEKSEEKPEEIEVIAEDSKEDLENSKEDADKDSKEDSKETDKDSKETDTETKEVTDEKDSKENSDDSKEAGDSKEKVENTDTDSKEDVKDSKEDGVESNEADKDSKESTEANVVESDKTEDESEEKNDSKEADVKDDSEEKSKESHEESAVSQEDAASSTEKSKEEEEEEKAEAEEKSETDSKEDTTDSKEVNVTSKEETDSQEGKDSKEEDSQEVKSRNRRDVENVPEQSDETSKEGEGDGSSEGDSMPEEELIQEIEIPENLRPRDHISQILKLDEDNEVKEKAIEKVSEVILKELKKVYDNAIQPLETLYKYRDLSNRHFGDPEIFSKPLVLFMGPWSGGKSSIINYLLDNEYKATSLRTGAEPSPAYFNILMHGEEEEVLDGTQLAADWTFSGLQKFGQGLLDRLRGLRFKNKLLEKVNIVEIPGILEVRKQVQRLFPFNDACQWFIDRADIIFLVYDPSKLDVGPETEAILDQLKGREYQTRIILNKADQVKPEELMRVQGALIWNISPLMSSAEPPVMYSTSLWSMPYEAGAPTRLLYAQERALLRDLRSAIDKRVEHKIASARRFAVRVRNHAKMVDCYLTTYYNHKTFFGNKRDTSDKIIENPQDYHIYEGLSTLTNISRYDLPDPDVYRDFFRLDALYDFPLLSSTCTYFRGCPINRLDVAIAYDLPELVGKYKKSADAAIHENEIDNSTS